MSNWGRWGEDDERGTLNLLTPDVVRSAVTSVRSGRVVSLSLPIRGSTSSPARLGVPHLPGRPLPQHFMSVDGGDYAAGVRPIGPGLCVCDDALMVSPHGTTTHLDALCHMWTDGKLYNGHDANRVRSYGATRCGIDKAGGIVTRGVLLDVAAVRGVPHLEPGERIGPAELESAAGGIEIRPGDAVLVRTGWPLVFAEDPSRYGHPQPGLSFDGGRWLAERDVALVGADNAAIAGLNDHGGCDEGVDEDLHLLFLWRHGIHLLEMLWLEELAGATDFLFMLAPLAIEGGTASPVNPLAVL